MSETKAWEAREFVGRGRRFTAVLVPAAGWQWRYTITGTKSGRVWLTGTAIPDRNDIDKGLTSLRLAMMLADRLIERLEEV